MNLSMTILIPSSLVHTLTMNMKKQSIEIPQYSSQRVDHQVCASFSSKKSFDWSFPDQFEWTEELMWLKTLLMLAKRTILLIWSFCMNIKVSLMEWSFATCLLDQLLTLDFQMWSFDMILTQSLRRCLNKTLIWFLMDFRLD